MLTRCPGCQTTFRVTTEQLKARQGRVRCGQCQAIFNALETLVEEAPPSVPPANDAIVIHGFDVSPIGGAQGLPSPGSPEPVPAEAPAKTATSPAQSVEFQGEAVAEPDIEYVEIAGLEGDVDTAMASGADTEINLDDARNLDFEDDFDAADATPPREPSPDDQFTKTVVGFTWYVEPESKPLPADELRSDEFARTTIAPWRITALESAPTPEQSATDNFADTVIESVRLAEPEAPAEVAHEPIADQFADTVIEPIMRAAAFEPAAQSVDQPAVDSVVEPFVVAVPEVELGFADEPAADDFAKTIVESQRLTEPATEEITDPEFDLAAIDDIHVEEVEESPSVLDAAVVPPPSFPALEPLPDLAEQPDYEPANAILEELELTTRPVFRRIQPTTDFEIAAEPLAAAEALIEPEPAPEPTFPKGSMPDLDADAESPIEPEPEPVPELQELPARRRWPWVLGALVATCLLAAQAIVHYRVELSVAAPRSKPALIAMCDLLNCKIALPSQIDLIGIETSDLSPGPEGAGHLQLAATLRNRAPFVQTWPHLELTLTDAADKALVRRALGPAEYLPPGRKQDEGFPARSEQPVHLDLKAPGVPAVGYRLYVFYP